MKTKIFSLILLAAFLLGGISFLVSQCKPKTSPPPEQTNDVTSGGVGKPKLVNAPDFNADSAYVFVQKQVDFGPRIPNTPPQAKCAAWMKSKLEAYNAKVYEQDLKVGLYNHQIVPCKNIIGSFNPEQKKRILLAAHWDTRPWSDRDPMDPKKPFDGADDGGSGVAVLLEIARHLSAQPTKVGVDIIFLDVEDYGPPAWDPASENREINGYCLGTQQWADHPHAQDYRAFFGILLDMVGAKNATFPQEGVSLQYAPSVEQKVWGIASSIGYGNYFISEKVGSIIDDHNFINSINGTPTIDIINLDRNSPTGFPAHWHAQQDNMNIIDKNTLKAVGQTLMQVIYSEPVEAS